MRIITTFFIALFFISCSKDDGPDIPDLKFPTDHLVEGSPWNLSGVEILRVTYNPDNLTVSEATSFFNEVYDGWGFSFNENRTGYSTLPDGSTYSFNWSLSTDWKTLTLTGNAPAVFTDVNITADTFSFSDSDYCVAIRENEDVCADVRFTLK